MLVNPKVPIKDGFWVAYLAKTKKENLFKYYIVEATTGLL